jgi:hypothetical protein
MDKCSSIGEMLARATLVPAAALLQLLGASLAYAQPASPDVDLAWRAPAACPPREAVLDEVARLVAASHERAHATARADVVRDERGRWRASLRVDARGAHGERTLEAESCPAIASATALIIAVAVEGGMLPPPAIPPPVAAAPTPLPLASSPTRSASQLIVAAAGVVDTAVLPSAAYGGQATLGWSYEWSGWRTRALASASFFAAQSAQSTAGAGRFMAIAASARMCASIVEGVFDVGPCLGVEFDSIEGKGASPAFQPKQGLGAWESAVGSLLASWTLSRRFAVFVDAGGLVSFTTRPTFVVQPGNLYVFVPSPAGLRGEIGLELLFF